MIVTTDRQSIFDLALQYFGSIEAAFDIASANGLSVTDDIEVGTELKELTSISLVNSDIVDYYKHNKIKPATAIDTEVLQQEGIEYWAIEIDFIVS